MRRGSTVGNGHAGPLNTAASGQLPLAQGSPTATAATPRAQRSGTLVPRCLAFLQLQGRIGVPRVKDVSIYYGTMFGSAEHYARRLAHEIMTQRRLRVAVHDLDAFDETALLDPSSLAPSRLYVYMVSTHFAGSPSPTAERFCRWIETLDTRSPDGNISPTASSRSVSAKRLNRRRTKRLPFSFLRRPNHPLKGMHYAVFGIGDSIYLTYNAVGKFVDYTLNHLGATRFLALGLGDCSKDLRTAFEVWEAQLLQRLPQRRSKSVVQGVNFVSSLSTMVASRRLTMKTTSVVPHDTLRTTTQVKVSQTRPVVEPSVAPQEEDTMEEASTHSLPVTSSLTIRDNFNRSVRLRFRCHILDHEDVAAAEANDSTRMAIETAAGLRTPRVALFDAMPFAEITPVESVGLSSSYSGSVSRERASAIFRVQLLQPETTFTTVSTLALFPHNSRHLVDEIAEAFGFELEAVIKLTVDAGRVGASDAGFQAQRQQLPFPTPCTVRVALTEFLELRTVTKDFLRVASGFVVTTEERRLLETLAEANEPSTAFFTILDLVAMAPTLQLPLEVLLNITPTMKPRYYTIASSPLVSPNSFDIAVALGRLNEPRGVGVSFFADVLATRTEAPVLIRGFISPSCFQFPDEGIAPMVFIATGVGLTAMRAIIQERLVKWFQRPTAASTAMPKHLLFLGAANEDSLVFSNDLRHWEQRLAVKVHFAFSNDRRHARQYVQDVVEARIDEVFETVSSSYGSRIFVCGRAAMVGRIRELFQADQMRRRSRWFDTVHASGRFMEEGYG